MLTESTGRQCGIFDLETLKVKVKIRRPPRRPPHFSGFRIQGQGQDLGWPMDRFQGHSGRAAAGSQGHITFQGQNSFQGQSSFQGQRPGAGFKVTPASGRAPLLQEAHYPTMQAHSHLSSHCVAKRCSTKLLHFLSTAFVTTFNTLGTGHVHTRRRVPTTTTTNTRLGGAHQTPFSLGDDTLLVRAKELHTHIAFAQQYW